MAVLSLITASFMLVAPSHVRAAGDHTVFATGSSCPSDSKQFDWEGSDSSVTGSVHSNAGMLVSGNNHTTIASATYAAACGVSLSGSGNVFGAGSPSPAAYEAPPAYLAPACTPDKTFSGDTNLADEAVGGVLSGVYCVFGGKLEIGAAVSGTVTLYTDGIMVLGASGLDLEPFENGIVLHSTLAGPDSITVSGSNSSVLGRIFAPNGEVEVSGQNVVAGCIVGQTVKLHGSNQQYLGCTSAADPTDPTDPTDSSQTGNGPTQSSVSRSDTLDSTARGVNLPNTAVQAPTSGLLLAVLGLLLLAAAHRLRPSRA